MIFLVNYNDQGHENGKKITLSFLHAILFFSRFFFIILFLCEVKKLIDTHQQ